MLPEACPASSSETKNLMPNLIGGAADLAPSTKTYMADMGDFSKDNYAGRNLHFGVRELAMSAIGNGLMLTAACGHLCPPSLCSAIIQSQWQGCPLLWACPLPLYLPMTSIGVGEDGPTR